MMTTTSDFAIYPLWAWAIFATAAALTLVVFFLSVREKSRVHPYRDLNPWSKENKRRREWKRLTPHQQTIVRILAPDSPPPEERYL